MNNNNIIEIAMCKSTSEINQALAFCGLNYEKYYKTHWNVAPDALFIAKKNDEIVATCGLAYVNKEIPTSSEKYYYLNSDMRKYIDSNRDSIAEMGRLSSIDKEATKVLMHFVIEHAKNKNISTLLAWANDSIFMYIKETVGINFIPIDVKLNLENTLTDTGWALPPENFFIRKDPPQLYFYYIPFQNQCHT